MKMSVDIDQMRQNFILQTLISAEKYHLNKLGLPTFDENDTEVSFLPWDIILFRCEYFIIEDEELVTLEDSHEYFCRRMEEVGFSCGPLDFENDKHPDLVEWAALPEESKREYARIDAHVKNANRLFNQCVENIKKAILKDAFANDEPEVTL